MIGFGISSLTGVGEFLDGFLNALKYFSAEKKISLDDKINNHIRIPFLIAGGAGLAFISGPKTPISSQSSQVSSQLTPRTPELLPGKHFRTPTLKTPSKITGGIIGHHIPKATPTPPARHAPKIAFSPPVQNQDTTLLKRKTIATEPKKNRKVSYGAAHEHNETTPTKETCAMFDLNKSDMNRYTLKDFGTSRCRKPTTPNADGLKRQGLDNSVIFMTSDTATHFQFKNTNCGLLGYESMYQLLLGLGAKEATDSFNLIWVKNHFRWIVWKLASMERSFPQEYGLQLLTPERVFAQLQYRYEREINRAQRSIIRKSMEGDDTPGRHIILCISAIRSQDPPILEVTDGWYCINASLDAMLGQYLIQGKLFVGQKLHICGAKIAGVEKDQPCTPLEQHSAMLSLHVNGTHRAKWFERLGTQSNPTFSVRLGSVKQNGGLIPCLDLRIERVYPVVYCETKEVPNGEMVDEEEAIDVIRLRRTQRGETEAQNVFHFKKENFVNEKRNEIQMREELEQRKELIKFTKMGMKLTDMDFETLFDFFLASSDKEGFLYSLSKEQRTELQSQLQSYGLNAQQQIDREINELIDNDSTMNRKVSSHIRIKVIDWPVKGRQVSKVRTTFINIWDPDSELVDKLIEGNRVHIYSLLPSKNQPRNPPEAIPCAPEITATKFSRWKFFDDKKQKEEIQKTEFTVPFQPRVITPISEMNRFKLGQYVDFIGVILSTTPKRDPEDYTRKFPGIPQKKSQLVAVTDASGGIALVQIVRIEDDFPPVSLLNEGMVIVVTNAIYQYYFLQHKAHVLQVTEVAIFTGSSTQQHVKAPLIQLRDWVKSSTDQISELRQNGKKILEAVLQPLPEEIQKPQISNPQDSHAKLQGSRAPQVSKSIQSNIKGKEQEQKEREPMLM